MSADQTIDSHSSQQPADAQPLVLQNFLRLLNAARRQCCLYGVEHPAAAEAAASLVEIASSVIETFGPSTFVFTEESVIVNDRWFEPSNDSRDLFQRLRSRGAMAVSLVGEISVDQFIEFLIYLNTQPREVRNEGGSSTYLRKHGVTRIVATDTIYSSEEEEGSELAPLEQEETIDRAISAVISWLMQKDQEEDLPHFKTTELLANPDAAAKLIREAVTKLHASNRNKRPSELATEVVSDLKDLASGDKAEWDNATPQIRKAISKLPREMRPELGAFGACDQDVEVDESKQGRTLQASEIEATVNGYLKNASLTPKDDALGDDHPDLHDFFGIKSQGLLSDWEKELQPAIFIRSSARTLCTLMAWESNALEHGQIARSVSSLVSTAIELSEHELALETASALCDQARDSEQTWRALNAQSALQGLGIPELQQLVEWALVKGNQKAQDAAALLVQSLPPLALAVMEHLPDSTNSHFLEKLKSGVVKSGTRSAPVLGQLVRNPASPYRWTALQMLTEFDYDWAFSEIDRALANAEPEFLVTALNAVSQIRHPMVAKICVDRLRHKSHDVRLAAIKALGSAGDESALELLTPLAVGRAYLQHQLAEKIAAIESLGRLAGPQMIPCLESISSKSPILLRRRYDAVSKAAKQAVESINARHNEVDKAA